MNVSIADSSLASSLQTTNPSKFGPHIPLLGQDWSASLRGKAVFGQAGEIGKFMLKEQADPVASIEFSVG